jgi:hypothetical protein
MQQQLKDANLNVGVDSGFTAPMDSMDKTTIALLNQFGLGHYLAFNDATDGRIPVAIARATGQHQNTSDLIMLPKTISGPEELMSEGNPDEGLKQFLTELEMAQIMGSLSVVRFPNQSLLTDQQLKPIFDQLRNKTKTNWLATNSKVSQWWRERSRVNVSIDTSSNELKLNIGISGSGTVNAASVIVNLPFANSNLRLLADGHQNKLTKTTTLDPWRVAVSLEGLPPGSYRWIMQFDPPNSALK